MSILCDTGVIALRMIGYKYVAGASSILPLTLQTQYTTQTIQFSSVQIGRLKVSLVPFLDVARFAES